MAEETKIKDVAAKPAKTPKKRSLKKIIGIVIGAVVALIIIIFIVVSMATSAPAKVANSFVSNIQSRNAPAAYALFSSEAKGAVTTDAFKTAVDQIGPILTGKPDMQSKEVSGETGSAAKATVIYKIAGSDSKTYEITVKLIKESGEWKVEDFNSAAL